MCSFCVHLFLFKIMFVDSHMLLAVAVFIHSPCCGLPLHDAPPTSSHSTDVGYLFLVWIVISMPSANGSSG